MIVFDKKFKFLLLINLFSSIITIVFTYMCSILNINILYSFSIVIVNFILFIIYKSQIDLVFFNKLIPSNFIFKMILLLSIFFIVEYFVYVYNFYILTINIAFLLFIIFDIFNMVMKNKSLILNSKS